MTRRLAALLVLFAAGSAWADEPPVPPSVGGPSASELPPLGIQSRRATRGMPPAIRDAAIGGTPAKLTWTARAGDPNKVLILRRAGNLSHYNIPAEITAEDIDQPVGGTIGGWEKVAMTTAGAGGLELGQPGGFTYAAVVVGFTGKQYFTIDSIVASEPSAKPAIAEWKISAVDDKGVALWWTVQKGVLGQKVLLRAPAGSKLPARIELATEPALGPLVGNEPWQVIALIPFNGRGFRDANVGPGSYVYGLALVEKVNLGPLGDQWLDLAISEAAQAVVPEPLSAPSVPLVKAPDNDAGTRLDVSWTMPDTPGVAFFVLRSKVGGQIPAYDKKNKKWTGGWEASHEEALPGDKREFADTVDGPRYYAIAAVRVGDDGAITATAVSPVSARSVPITDWFNEKQWGTLAVVLLMALFLWFYIPRVRKDPDSIYIRRIPGVDAIEEAIGRSTEMGRPVLYVTGVENIQNIQTIASLLCLGPIAEMTAEYDTELKVANFEALTMVVAEEIVKQGYANAGRADAHRPENVMFISSEQFAFAAGVNGIILRDKPATNIYLGRFFAESLILAETGYVTKSIQIAGTAEVTQLPFFIAACDYTIIGEELYAVSAYLSRDPKLLATLKATDAVKLVIVLTVLVGAILATLGIYNIGPEIAP